MDSFLPPTHPTPPHACVRACVLRSGRGAVPAPRAGGGGAARGGAAAGRPQRLRLLLRPHHAADGPAQQRLQPIPGACPPPAAPCGGASGRAGASPSSPCPVACRFGCWVGVCLGGNQQAGWARRSSGGGLDTPCDSGGALACGVGPCRWSTCTSPCFSTRTPTTRSGTCRWSTWSRWAWPSACEEGRYTGARGALESFCDSLDGSEAPKAVNWSSALQGEGTRKAGAGAAWRCMRICVEALACTEPACCPSQGLFLYLQLNLSSN